MPSVKWLEVSLTVDGEAAEAVADVLARFTSEGVVIESTRVTAGPEDEGGQSVGPLLVRGYLPADASVEDARQRVEEALWHMRQLLPIPEAEYRWVKEEDWAETWKQHYRPVRIGKRLMIVPAWLNPPLDPGDVPIRMDPGMAFGTGTHPTTQLCLDAIESNLRPGAPVLDLGCGSGILAVAAARLGAGPVVALDIDLEAVRVSRENAMLNGVVGTIRIEQGSLDEALHGDFGQTEWDLVVANILAPVLVRMLAGGLAKTVRPGGVLILSGILSEQRKDVERAAEEVGLSAIRVLQAGDWVALVNARVQ